MEIYSVFPRIWFLKQEQKKLPFEKNNGCEGSSLTFSKKSVNPQHLNNHRSTPQTTYLRTLELTFRLLWELDTLDCTSWNSYQRFTKIKNQWSQQWSPSFIQLKKDKYEDRCRQPTPEEGCLQVNSSCDFPQDRFKTLFKGGRPAIGIPERGK